MQVCHWPDYSALPPPGEPVLIRIAVSPVRKVARLDVRSVLRIVLASWSGLPAAQLPLVETACGPVWRTGLPGMTLAISLTYGAGEAWMGLVRGGRIGVDVIRIESFAEAAAVARDYLVPAAVTAIAQARDPARAFAAAWTQQEARLKCAGCGLAEWPVAVSSAIIETPLEGPDWMGAVAVMLGSGTRSPNPCSAGRIASSLYPVHCGRLLEKCFHELLAETGNYNRIGSYWERGNQNEIDLVALNDMKKTITIADIKLNKSKLSVEGLKRRAQGLIASYPRHQPEWLGLSVENIADFLPKGT